MKSIWKKAGIVALVGGILWACTKPTTENPADSDALSSNRKEVLTNLADNIIIPRYKSMQYDLNQLKQQLQAFEAAPTVQTLHALQSSMTTAYIGWQSTELFDVGPAESVTLRYFFNIYPTNVDIIAQNIQNPNANLEIPSNYAAQGFPAIDYLLHGIDSTDAGILAYYTTDVNAAKRLAYLNKIVDHMVTLNDQVYNSWTGDYRNTFINRTKLDIGSSTSLLVNGLTLHYERYIRSGKIGIPSGAMMNGVVAPEKVESFYSPELSGSLARTAHTAFVQLFNGQNSSGVQTGTSIKSYLDAIEAKDPSTQVLLSKVINDQLDVCQQKLAGLDNNFHDQIISDNQKMKDAYAELQKTVRLLKVDMASAMSITITYTDNDGD